MTSPSIHSGNGSGPGSATTSTGEAHRADVPGVGPPDLLTLVTHELREPLGLLDGYLSMLDEGDLTDEQRTAAVTTMRAKVLEMAHLVEVLLTAARVDGGLLQPRLARFDVRAAVHDAVAAVSARAMLSGASIQTALPAAPVVTYADHDHVVRILVNLLANALSYSRSPARIEVEVQPANPMRVAVRDHGNGIAASEHERVFRRFIRLEEEAMPRTPGFGLGLPLSRELAEASGGTLVLESSAPCRGSVFVLRLPAAVEATGDDD